MPRAMPVVRLGSGATEEWVAETGLRSPWMGWVAAEAVVTGGQVAAGSGRRPMKFDCWLDALIAEQPAQIIPGLGLA